MKIFDWLGQITCKKKQWESFSESEQKTFNTFIINRFLSMRPEWTDMVNELQIYTMGIPLKSGDVYKLYCDIFPKESRPAFIRYIKGKKEKKYDDEHPNEIFANIISKQITKNNLNNRIKNYLN